jgi:putative ABC transport system permease protein
MIRHIFKMIWNKKKQNALLMIEMLVSFLVVFAVFTLLVYNFQNFKRSMGFDYNNVWVINFNTNDEKAGLDTVLNSREGLRNQLKSMPEIRYLSYTGSNLPFSMSTNNGTITHNKQEVDAVNHYTVEDDYDDVLNMHVIEGRWFTKADIASKDLPVVINQRLKEKIFGNGNAVGQYLSDPSKDSRREKIIGVVENTKFGGDYDEVQYDSYFRADTASYRWLGRILIKVAPTTSAEFESRLHKSLASSLKDANVEIQHLAETRVTKNSFFLVPMIILLIVAGLLIINVALGLFGVLWYNINKRRGEIGLRRAIGASGVSVSKQLVGEALALSTFALILGSFFAVQFPLLKLFDIPAGVYLIAWILALLFVYLLVVLCAYYPGRQAAAIRPAVALHEE